MQVFQLFPPAGFARGRKILSWGFSIVFILAGPYLPAQEKQTYTVKGQVLSLTDELPLAGIKVILKGTDFGAQTDSLGVFRFSGVPRGVYDIVAKYPDFDATILKNVAIPPATKKDYIFNLTSNNNPLPYVDTKLDGELGLLKGFVHARIDTFKSLFAEGRLLLRATRAGELTRAYIYPRYFEILPVSQQDFRFRFYLPRGQKYHLYLIWQMEKKNYVFEQILDVARDEIDPAKAKVFDLGEMAQMGNINFSLNTKNLQSK